MTFLDSYSQYIDRLIREAEKFEKLDRQQDYAYDEYHDSALYCEYCQLYNK
jgi:hypothetical protein